MNCRTSFWLVAFVDVIAIAFSGCALNSSVRDYANEASPAVDAVRERNGQGASPEAVAAIFAKAASVAEDGAINFCGFYLGMPGDDARTLAAHYGLKDDQWQVFSTPTTKVVFQLTFTTRSIRRIAKCGSSFDELSQSVTNRIGRMKPKSNGDKGLFGYEYKNIDGQTAFLSGKEGLVLLDSGWKRKATVEAARSAVAKLASDMVPIPGRDYAMCKHEVTQALWESVMGINPSKFKGADLPVEQVSWSDCQDFLENLNAWPEVKASGKTYRLPTADEWEFACRAGAKGGYCKLANGTEITLNTLDEVAWFKDNSGDRTHPVGQKKPNAFGLYDMHGNVGEWTSTADGVIRFSCGGDCKLPVKLWSYEMLRADYRSKENDYSRALHGLRLASGK